MDNGPFIINIRGRKCFVDGTQCPMENSQSTSGRKCHGVRGEEGVYGVRTNY